MVLTSDLIIEWKLKAFGACTKSFMWRVKIKISASRYFKATSSSCLVPGDKLSGAVFNALFYFFSIFFFKSGFKKEKYIKEKYGLLS